MSSFILKPRQPFRLDLTVWALRRRVENAIDHWDGCIYRRVLLRRGEPMMIEVAQLSGSGPPRLSVCIYHEHAETQRTASESRVIVTAALERLLGIRLDLRAFYESADRDATLGPLARRFRGMKPPRFLTLFECMVNAIACQQISLAAGIQMLNRFVEAFGRPCRINGTRGFAFPQPDDLVDVNPEELRPLGFSRQKSAALLNLAQWTRSREVDLKKLQSLSDEAVAKELCLLRGIGRWSAEYAMLRGMGRLHVFPGDDVGARNNLCQWLGFSEKRDYDGVAQTLHRWRPFGGLIYFHLLLDKLAAAGHIS